jgi:tRNA threonylcarbamoyladenosine biosynthesis protein TsaE
LVDLLIKMVFGSSTVQAIASRTSPGVILINDRVDLMKITIQTNNEDETRSLGRRLGQLLQPGTVVALHGTLGSGKTRLTQGIGVGLGISEQTIVSPTYTICVPYFGRLYLVHIDAYRIEDPMEVDELGLDELLEDGAVLVVEWAEKIKNELPPIDIDIRLEQVDEHQRLIHFACSTQGLLEQLVAD